MNSKNSPVITFCTKHLDKMQMLSCFTTTSNSVYSECNQMINCCLNKFPREQFGNECDEIETTLQQIIRKAMDMNLSVDELPKFPNVFMQLLSDLRDLQLEWLIRLPPSDKLSRLLQSQIIVPVDNIWNECFKVVNLESFVEMFRNLYNSEEIPKHYQLKVVQMLLRNLKKLVSRQNCICKECLSDKDLLAAMTIMTNSIRSSLVRLNEQMNYYSFEVFVLSLSQPCVQTTEKKSQDLHLIDKIDSVEPLDPENWEIA